MRISVFWGQERLTDRSISKRYLKSDIATWVEKSSTSRAIHARDTGFYWSSENALHERFIASSGVGVWMKHYNSLQSNKKTLAFEYEFSFRSVICQIELSDVRPQPGQAWLHKQYSISKWYQMYPPPHLLPWYKAKQEWNRRVGASYPLVSSLSPL